MPISSLLPRVNFHHLRNLLTVLLCLQVLGMQAPLAWADDFDDALKARASSINDSLVKDALVKEDSFLPVTEAYKLSAAINNTNDGKHLRLTWAIAPNYYLYQERFKFRATPEVSLTPRYSPDGVAKFDEFAGKNMTVHHNQVTVDFLLAPDTPTFDLKVTSQGCAEAGLCYPPYSENLRIDPSAGTAEPSAPNSQMQASSPAAPIGKPVEAKLWVWEAVLFALLGGVILNLMPCVFPVLSIKVMSLVKADSRRLRLHGWAYTLGIMICFLAFASVLLVAKSGGEAIGWGFQLQSPGLIVALAYLLFTMGLSMSGMLEIGMGWMGAGQTLTQKSGLAGSFFTGVLAALVASPCTAPFMGAALGFALTQPSYVCLLVFAALGLGMALPLLLLCYLPQLANRLPRPGIWMETLKEFLAFPLYLSAIWLLWVLANQAGTNLMAGVCAGALAVAFAAWISKRPAHGKVAAVYKAVALLALVTAIAIPYQLLKIRHQDTRWQAYSPELLSRLRNEGRPVFIDLTADWCLTCLANERVTLSSKTVEAAFDEYKVATLKGDWTNSDPTISKLLQEYGRTGVPLYLWFPANRAGQAEVLPQLLTPSLVVDAIKAKK